MGTFAAIAITDYRLSLADQEKQTSVIRLHLQQTNGSCYFLLVPDSTVYICCHFKRKTEAQAIFLSLFTVCSSSNGNLFFVCLLQRNKQKLSVCKRINGRNVHTCPSMVTSQYFCTLKTSTLGCAVFALKNYSLRSELKRICILFT